MMILLGILKWIGIILLLVLILLIVILLIGLFTPIRYKVTAHHPDRFIKARGSFFLHFIHVTYIHESNKGEFKIYLLGYQIGKHKKSKEKKKKKVSKKKTTSKKNKITIKQLTKLAFRSKNSDILPLLWQQLLYLLNHMKPKHLTCDIKFSTGDPANTAMVLGGISLIPALMKPGVVICPDFIEETRYLKGNLDTRGWIQGITLLIVGIRIYKNQQIRNLLKKNKEA